MALHSLTGDSRVGNVGRRPVVEPPSKSSSKGNASSSTSGVIVNSMPINAKPDVQSVPDLKSAMVVRSTSLTSARGVRLPVPSNSILKSLLVGLALFAKGVSASNIPNCTAPAEVDSFYALNICGPGNQFIDGCVISSDLQRNLDALYENSPFRVNGTNVFYPNMTGVNLTAFKYNFQTFVELVNQQSAGTVNGCNAQEQQYLQDYCLAFACKVYTDLVDLVGQTLAPSPSPTAFVEPEEVIKLSVGNASLGSLGAFIFYQLLFLGIDMCLSKSKKVDEENQGRPDGQVISTLRQIKSDIGTGSYDTQIQRAENIVKDYLDDINETLTRKFFVKDYANSLVKLVLGCVSAFMDANSDECSYDKQPSSMISNYFLMGAAAEFLFSKLDQRFWSEQCSRLITYSKDTNTKRADGTLKTQVATILVEAKQDANTAGDQTIQEFIDIVHSPVQLADMTKMWAHVVPILFSVCLFSATSEQFSTCEDNQFNKELYWGFPLALVLFKGLLDVFCYPTELSVQKKSELKRFANDNTPIRQEAADIESGNSQELQRLMTAQGSSQDGSDEDVESVGSNGQATRTDRVQQGGRQQAGGGIELTAVRLGTGGNGPVVGTGSEQQRDHQVTEPAELTDIVLQGVSGDRRGEDLEAGMSSNRQATSTQRVKLGEEGTELTGIVVQQASGVVVPRGEEETKANVIEGSVHSFNQDGVQPRVAKSKPSSRFNPRR